MALLLGRWVRMLCWVRLVVLVLVVVVMDLDRQGASPHTQLLDHPSLPLTSKLFTH